MKVTSLKTRISRRYNKESTTEGMVGSFVTIPFCLEKYKNQHHQRHHPCKIQMHRRLHGDVYPFFQRHTNVTNITTQPAKITPYRLIACTLRIITTLVTYASNIPLFRALHSRFEQKNSYPHG